MKSKTYFKTTTAIQLVYLSCIALFFALIYLLKNNILHTYGLVYVGSLIIQLLPIETICFVVNLFFLIREFKKCPISVVIIKTIVVFFLFALLCIFKMLFYRYSDVLVGIV